MFQESAKIGFCFPKGSVFRRCQLLFLHPTMVGGITQRWINTKLQFFWSNNWETYCKIYLRLISVSFPHFQRIVCFWNIPFGVASSVLMKSSFSQNQIFNRKWNSFINSFLVVCLKPFVANITFINWWNRTETNVTSKA